MNNIELQKTWVQGRPVVVDNLLGTAFTGEAGAHTFKIRGVDAAQETVTISGTITGKLLAANNVTISLSGSIEDGCAVVTLTDECYDVPGRFIFSVYATSGSTTLCLYCAVGNVLRTDSQVIAYPTESLPNITSLMADLEQILADWPADYSQLQSDVSSLKSAIGDLDNLETTDKTSAVDAINEVYGMFTGDVGEAVTDWLDDHPEATTTVQDHSLTYVKLVNGTLGFVTPEMFGAKGDGVTDDTQALQDAINTKSVLLMPGKTYLVTDTINVPRNTYINGNGSKIKRISSGVVLRLKSYETFISNYNWEISVIENIKIEGTNCIDMVNAIRFMLHNVELHISDASAMSKGLVLGANGYENCFDSIVVFSPSANSNVGFSVQTTDCTFKNIYIIGCKYGFDIYEAANRYYNIHGWIRDSATYDGSVLILDKTQGAGCSTFEDVYFDTYQTGVNKRNTAAIVIKSPFWYNNNNVVQPNSSYLIKFAYEVISDSNALRKVKIIDANIQADSTQFNIANNSRSSGGFYFGFVNIPDLVLTKAFANNNIFYLNTVDRTDAFITLGTGLTLVSGKIWQTDNVVNIDVLIQSTTPFPANASTTIGSFYATLDGIYNTVAFIGDNQWGDTSIDPVYVYASANQLSIYVKQENKSYLRLSTQFMIK